MVRHVCTYENAFAISHLSALYLCENQTLQIRNRSVSRILYFDLNRSGDHSSSPAVAGLDRATYPEVVANRNSLRAGSPIDASLFGLALRGVCLAAHVTTRAGALLPHHFTHYPFRAGLLSVALVVAPQH